MKRPTTGRADLLRAFCAGGELRQYLASELGFEPHVESLPRSPQREKWAGSEVPAASPAIPAERVTRSAEIQHFLRVESYRCRDETFPEKSAEELTLESDGPARIATPIPFEPLAPLSRIVARLRRLAGGRTLSRALDLKRLIQQLARGQMPRHIPKRLRPAWASEFHIVDDLAERLIPYREDQIHLWRELSKLIPAHALTRSQLLDRERVPYVVAPRQRRGDSFFPQPGATVLALSDLGSLSARPSDSENWRRMGEWLVTRGCVCVALVPCRTDDVSAEVSIHWRVLPWEQGNPTAGIADAVRGEILERLLVALSHAVRVEPRLLRRVRRLLPGGRDDAGLESRFWQHDALSSRHSVAASFDVTLVNQLRAKWQTLDEEFRTRVLAQIFAEHGGRYEGIWHLETLNLGADGQHLIPPTEIAAARRWFSEVERELRRDVRRTDSSAVDFTHNAQRWFGDAGRRAHPVLRRIEGMIVERNPRIVPPPDYDPRWEESSRDVTSIAIREQGDVFLVGISDPRKSTEPYANWGLVATIRAKALRVGVFNFKTHSETEFDINRDFWAAGKPPSWASDWGIDEFGPWATLQVFGEEGAVVQRMRWIPPGAFLMGSREDEPGRFADEGPQHEMTISRGYWMFDTPCTQALWQAVMGDNPSYFRSPTRPVETVSWEECQKFHLRMREIIPGLEIDFPTEAEWEYACRAGANGPPYNGPFEILGANNAPALDPVAWYGGNCGIDFELTNGYDTTDWNEKQYQFSKGGTHPVAQKQANAVGLYDMLGNVLEWCADGQRNYSASAATDPVGSTRASAERVVRGGSWYSNARNVRAAYRASSHPGYQFNSLGFRCRVQSGEPSQQARAAERRTEGAVSGRSRFAEHGGDSEPATAVRSAAWVQLIDRDFDQTQAPAGPVVRVVTDLEELTLRRIKRPSWASAIGRDEYGLWAEFEVPVKRRQSENSHSGSVFEKLVSIQHKITARLQGNRSKDDEDPWHVVTQRLRWIPPGRFLFGSPKDEPGRVDSREFEPIEKTITNGFWMFDTPCTQELWETIMGKNPSHFQSPSRPVEQVSWNDCQEFLTRSSDRFKETHKGLRLCLPKEVEWEYACRAGTQTATYAGPVEYLGDANAPALDPIAWYGGNCGVEFELTNGYDPSWLKQRQYNFKAGGTHPVGKKEANAWGLYDTLGNVWEWCEDVRIASGEEGKTPADDASAARVVRGGSWYGSARYVRAAYRLSYHPGRQRRHLGFRCRVQTGEPNQ